MRFSIIALVLPLAAALPSPSPANTTDVAPSARDLTEAELLEKRNTNEGVYLSNCHFTTANTWSSEMHYYANARGASQNGQQPDDKAILNQNNRITWEGSQRCGTFPTGVQFCSQIASNGQSLGTGAYAGPGWNDFNGYDCFKDNGRRLFTIGSTICYSIYFCFSQV